MSDEAGTKPEGADPTKEGADAAANPEGSGGADAGQSADAGTQSTGLTEQQIAEYRSWKESLGKANVTDPRALVEDYTRKSQRAAELEDALSRERQASDILRGRAQQQEDPIGVAYKQWQDNYYTADAPALLQRYLDLRDAKREQDFSARTMQQFQLQQRIPVAAQMLGINDQGALAARLKSVHSSLTPDELALVELSRSNKLDSYLAQSRTQREAEARRATALDQFGAIRGAPRIPGDSPDGDAKLIPFEEWAAASPEAKKRLRTAKEKFVIVGAPKHFDPNND